MSEESARIQSRLIRDLEPVVAVELERHLKVQKNWYPHEYVPWSEGRDYAGPLNGDAWEAKDSRLTPVAQDSLVLNLLTEDNLPSYHTEIALSMGRDGAWGNWIERWTAEEARHAIVIRDYLMATRGVDPYELEDLRMAHMSLGYQTPYENDMLHTIAYVSFQELATRISHRNTGKLSNDPIAEGMMQRVALDENLHMLFYRNTLSAALDMEPNAAMRAIADVVTNFDMQERICRASDARQFRLHSLVSTICSSTSMMSSHQYFVLGTSLNALIFRAMALRHVKSLPHLWIRPTRQLQHLTINAKCTSSVKSRAVFNQFASPTKAQIRYAP
jgi:acyl-[acyl-carrier-protein] desaturase